MTTSSYSSASWPNQGSALSDSDEMQDQRLRLALTRYQCVPQTTLPDTVPTPEAKIEKEGAVTSSASLWHISLRFGPDVLRNGMDPAAFLRYLCTLGTISALETIHQAIPDWEQFDPENCYLGYEIDFDSQADKAAISDVFEFVRDDCQIVILPPTARSPSSSISLNRCRKITPCWGNCWSIPEP